MFVISASHRDCSLGLCDSLLLWLYGNVASSSSSVLSERRLWHSNSGKKNSKILVNILSRINLSWNKICRLQTRKAKIIGICLEVTNFISREITCLRRVEFLLNTSTNIFEVLAWKTTYKRYHSSVRINHRNHSFCIIPTFPRYLDNTGAQRNIRYLIGPIHLHSPNYLL